MANGVYIYPSFYDVMHSKLPEPVLEKSDTNPFKCITILLFVTWCVLIQLRNHQMSVLNKKKCPIYSKYSFQTKNICNEGIFQLDHVIDKRHRNVIDLP